MRPCYYVKSYVLVYGSKSCHCVSPLSLRYGHVFLWDSGSSVGEIIGHSKSINAIDYRPVRPFRVVTAGEDKLVNWYEGPPFRFKSSLQVCWSSKYAHLRDVQDCQQRLNSGSELPLIFPCSLIQTLTLTPPPNNALLAILDMYGEHTYGFTLCYCRFLLY